MPTALVILAEGFEEIEAITPIDILRRAGAEVTVAALTEGIHVTGRSGLTLHADTTLTAVGAQEFNCLILPGGPGVKHLRADLRVRAILHAHARSGRWIAAICAAPTILHDAGLLENRRYTAHFSVASELANVLAAERVVVDGPIVTARGAGTSLDFALRLASCLFSDKVAADVSRSICT
jgi:4-methyl-5(b-hydroxyethyl)-thiazole monophosphate biosynthesis